VCVILFKRNELLSVLYKEINAFLLGLILDKRGSVVEERVRKEGYKDIKENKYK
jgi:hypothetical protein